MSQSRSGNARRNRSSQPTSEPVVVPDDSDPEQKPPPPPKAAAESTEDLQNTCGICFEVVVERGILNCCQHLFCKGCILHWAEVTNLCPLCKSRFTQIVPHVAVEEKPAGVQTQGKRKRKAPAAAKAIRVRRKDQHATYSDDERLARQLAMEMSAEDDPGIAHLAHFFQHQFPPGHVGALAGDPVFRFLMGLQLLGPSLGQMRQNFRELLDQHFVQHQHHQHWVDDDDDDDIDEDFDTADGESLIGDAYLDDYLYGASDMDGPDFHDYMNGSSGDDDPFGERWRSAYSDGERIDYTDDEPRTDELNSDSPPDEELSFVPASHVHAEQQRLVTQPQPVPTQPASGRAASLRRQAAHTAAPHPHQHQHQQHQPHQQHQQHDGDYHPHEQPSMQPRRRARAAPPTAVQARQQHTRQHDEQQQQQPARRPRRRSVTLAHPLDLVPDNVASTASTAADEAVTSRRADIHRAVRADLRSHRSAATAAVVPNEPAVADAGAIAHADDPVGTAVDYTVPPVSAPSARRTRVKRDPTASTAATVDPIVTAPAVVVVSDGDEQAPTQVPKRVRRGRRSSEHEAK